MRVPALAELGGLGRVEAEALRSLGYASIVLSQEWTSTSALLGRLFLATDIADGSTQGQEFTHYSDALHEVSRAAIDYEFAMGAIGWRYVSAYAVLGTTLLDRLVQQRPPLPPAAVRALCKEPTLGQLRDALSIPAKRLLPARDTQSQQMTDETRQELLVRVQRAEFNVTHYVCGDGPVDQQAVDAALLSTVTPPDIDRDYEDLLDPVSSWAQQTAFEISYHLQHEPPPSD